MVLEACLHRAGEEAAAQGLHHLDTAAFGLNQLQLAVLLHKCRALMCSPADYGCQVRLHPADDKLCQAVSTLWLYVQALTNRRKNLSPCA